MVLGHAKTHELKSEFFDNAIHSEDFPAPPSELAKYVKVINLLKDNLVAHIAQDYSSEDPSENFATLYLSTQDKATPEFIDR